MSGCVLPSSWLYKQPYPRLFVFVCCRCICSLLTGNHDLEGMDEFETDEENLEAWMKHFNRDMPQFCTQVSSWTPSNDSTYSGHCIYAEYRPGVCIGSNCSL